MSPAYSLKSPLVIDLSQTDLGSPLAQANPKPLAVFARATVARYPDINQTYACKDVVTDPSAPAVWVNAKANQIPFGVYSYILQGSMERQVQQFISDCKNAGFYSGGKWQLDFPPVADVEVDIPTPPKPKTISPVYWEKWAAQVYQWLIEVEAAFGVRPWIYTSRMTWAWLLSNGGTGNAPAWTGNYKFWIAWYPDYPDNFSDLPNAKIWPTGVTPDIAVLWQYADDGRSQGYQYNDLNVPTKAGQVYFSDTAPVPQPIPPAPQPDQPPSNTTTTPAVTYVSGTLTMLKSDGTNETWKVTK